MGIQVQACTAAPIMYQRRRRPVRSITRGVNACAQDPRKRGTVVMRAASVTDAPR